MLRALTNVSNQFLASFGVFGSFLIIEASQEWGRTLCNPWEWASKPIKRCKGEDQREKSIMKQFCMVMRNLHMLGEIQRTAVSKKIWSTFWSLLSRYYISFWISGSQEFNASNGVQFGAETRKLWPIEGNCTKLKKNFALTFPDAKIFALTFPDAKIFTLTFPNAKIFAAHFPNAKIFALTFSDAKFFAPPFSNAKM